MIAFVSNLLFFISCLSLYSTYGIALVFLPNLEIIFLINLFDEIKIKKNKSKTDKVKFYGKFCNKINKNNTITKTINIISGPPIKTNITYFLSCLLYPT